MQVTRAEVLRPWQAATADAVLVLGFAAAGRSSHQESQPVVGALLTAWPFLVGASAGWALVRWRSGRWPQDVGAGVPVWAGAVLVGMLLRAATGQGTALAFVMVATAVLGGFLLGWRALAARFLTRE